MLKKFTSNVFKILRWTVYRKSGNGKSIKKRGKISVRCFKNKETLLNLKFQQYIDFRNTSKLNLTNPKNGS